MNRAFWKVFHLIAMTFENIDIFHIMNEWMNPSVCSVIEYIDMQRRNIVLHWCNTVGQPSVFQTSAQINDTLSFFSLFLLLFLFKINDTFSFFSFPFSRSIIHFPFPFTFPFPDQWYTFIVSLSFFLLLFQINNTLSFFSFSFSFYFSFSRSMIHFHFPFWFYFSLSRSMIHFPFLPFSFTSTFPDQWYTFLFYFSFFLFQINDTPSMFSFFLLLFHFLLNDTLSFFLLLFLFQINDTLSFFPASSHSHPNTHTWDEGYKGMRLSFSYCNKTLPQVKRHKISLLSLF